MAITDNKWPVTSGQWATAKQRSTAHGPRSSPLVVIAVALVTCTMGLLAILPFGCSHNVNSTTRPLATQLMRVRILIAQDQVVIAASQPPTYRSGSDPTERTLGLPPNTPVSFTLVANVWKAGNTPLGGGVFSITPAVDASVTINGAAYRGQFRLVPVAPNKFDVVNDVNVDAYLYGVLSRELLTGWHQEAYRAQAIVARTYALYEREKARDRYWDVFADQSSQVYGGVAAETAKSREAVDYTRGIVVVYGPPGQEHIFKTYFSSCCGGVSQSVTDAFNEPYIEPLSEQNTKGICSACPRFNWGPVVIKKDELTRRFRIWGTRHAHPIKDMQIVARVEIAAQNVYGRPVRFKITDARGDMCSLSGEELRTAVNTDAGADHAGLDKSGQQIVLWSSFVKVISEPDSDVIRFVEGHGWGHGVGMCQWCAQRRAEAGMSHEAIVLAAYQRATLMKAY